METNYYSIDNIDSYIVGGNDTETLIYKYFETNQKWNEEN